MAQPELITLTNPRSPASEAYRTLRTNLIFSSINQALHTLVVTSPAPEEGKSVTLANLAITFAQGGKKTLLVDCDLRRPNQHTIWGAPQEPGPLVEEERSAVRQAHLAGARRHAAAHERETGCRVMRRAERTRPEQR